MRFKIATKIAFGFGFVIIAVCIYSILTRDAIQRNQDVNEKSTTIYSPSLEWINQMQNQVIESRMLIKSWVHIDKISDTPDKIRLKDLHSRDYPILMDTLKTLSTLWGLGEEETEAKKAEENRLLLEKIDLMIRDTLFRQHQSIMEKLGSFESYDDPFVVFEVTPMTEEGGEVMDLTDKILSEIIKLKSYQDEKVNEGRIKMVEQFKALKKFVLIMLIILIIVSVVVGAITIRSLANPINKTKAILLQMSRGVLPKEQLTEGHDEVGQMSKALNGLIQGLRDITDFTSAIGKGNFDVEFRPLSEDDTLGLSLLEMREELKAAKEEEEKRQQENQQRNWASQGVALFSDILRKNNDNLKALSYEIISNMVRYTNSNQGGIFIVNDNDKSHVFLEMTACYAYDRQKYLQKHIEVGEGLVGRCYQEQEKIFLTEIPADYIKITSGLGNNNPTCLLLIPLSYNDNIFGIMEIASFNVYRDFEIEFIERIGENIAATISSAKANIQTVQLLEQSQQQAEEMASQEEEMRQNMEELRATQEQSARREEELHRELEMLRKKMKERV